MTCTAGGWGSKQLHFNGAAPTGHTASSAQRGPRAPLRVCTTLHAARQTSTPHTICHTDKKRPVSVQPAAESRSTANHRNTKDGPAAHVTVRPHNDKHNQHRQQQWQRQEEASKKQLPPYCCCLCKRAASGAAGCRRYCCCILQ